MSTTEATSREQVTNELSPGIYRDLPEEEYFALSYVHATGLPPAEKSMAHYKWARDHPQEPTPAMKTGRLWHLALSDPLAIQKRYVVMPVEQWDREVEEAYPGRYRKVRASGAWKDRRDAFLEVHPGKETVSQDQYDLMAEAVRVIHGHKGVRHVLGDRPQREVSLVWDDPATGLRCKARLDVVNRRARILGDFKTTDDASQFDRRLWDYRYDRQMAFYVDGWFTLTGGCFMPWLIAVEKAPPYGVRASKIGRLRLAGGRRDYQRLLQEIAVATERDEWPCYEDPEQWDGPAWALPNLHAEP